VIPQYPYQMPPQIQPVVGPGGGMVNPFYYLLVALFNRTGGQGGVPFTVGNSLAASGSGQTNALVLVNDYNEVLTGTGGVQLAALQPGQTQIVYNATGASIIVYPTPGGQIDTNTPNAGITLANGTTASFTAYEILAGGGTLYRSAQVGQPVADTAWTPKDASGAALVFTGASGFYQIVGNLVFVWGTLTYPVTADPSAAKISLPLPVPNQSYAQSPGRVFILAAPGFLSIVPVAGTSTAALYGDAFAGAEVNSSLSTGTVNFSLFHPLI
jgi:hypothetical protein